MKGIFSLDAVMSVLLLLFILIAGQAFVSSDFGRANEFGVNYEAKAEAIRVGSLMNTFFSTKPGAYDYALFAPSEARVFKDSSASFFVEKKSLGELNVTLVSRFDENHYSYPVSDVVFISVNKVKVS